MRELKNEMHTVLNLIKDFDVGYTGAVDNQIMIDYKGKRYMITIEELCNTEDESMFNTMCKYWKR